ncbi:MAG: RHS repeat-associated core domain-containing protein [Ilumatobacteraceae bacterium]
MASAGPATYSPRSAKVSAADDVPQSVIDAHAADVAVARGLEGSTIVAADESGPVPLPIGGGAVPLPDGDATAFEPPVITPVDDGEKGVLPQPEPPADMPKGAAADGFDVKSAVEVNERPDAFTTVFEDADGTRAMLVSSVPVNFEDGLGGWKKIDNRVVSDGAGGLTNAANEWRVTFGVMQAGRGVMISTSDGDLSFAADGAREVAPVVEPDGVSVRYVDVFADTDLVYVVTGVGVEELLVLKSAKGTSAVTFSIVGAQFDAKPSGLESRDGGIGRRVTISTPEIFDGDGRPVAVEHQVFSSRDDGVDKSKVTVGVTAEYLRSLPADEFPVTVDPSVSLWLGTSWLHSYANWMSSGAWYDSFSDGYARVGNPVISSGNGVRWRTTGFFDYHPYIGASVVDAALYTTMAAGGSTSRSLNVYWAHQDSFNYGVNPRWHTQSTPPSSAYTLTTTNPYVTSTLGAVGSAAWHNGTWFPTLYNNWTRTSHLNGTLLFRGNESTGINTYKKFTVAVLLVINRWPAPPTSTVTRTGNTVNWTGTSATDPDGDTQQYIYRMWHDVNNNAVIDGGEPSQDVGWTTSTTATQSVPASWTGPNVRNYVFNYDGYTIAGEAHMNVTLMPKFPNSPPTSPVITAPAVGTTIISLTPTLTVNPSTDPDGHPLKYQFWICPQPLTPITPLPSQCRTSGLIPATSWAVPANYMVWNEPYSWWVGAYDDDKWNTTNSAGSFVASYTAAQIAQIGAGYNPYSADAAGVDTANGNYRITRTDISVPGVGADLSIARTLDTMLVTGAVAINGAFGKGWAFSLDMSVRTDTAGNPFVMMPDGSEQFFGKNADGTYSRTMGGGNTLAKVGNEWRLTDVSGIRYDFDAVANPGKLLRVTDKAGHVVQSNWSVGNTVQEFKDVASGRTMTLTYTTPAGATRPHVSQVATASIPAHGGALVWKYYYQGDLLTRVCDPRNNASNGKCEVYGYDGSNRLTTITAVAGNTHTTLTYDSSNRVLTLKNAYNNTWTFDWTIADPTITPPAPNPPFTVRRTKVTDPRGNVVLYDFDVVRRLVHRVDQFGKQRWYSYDGNGFLAQTINELGEIEQFVNDEKGNVTRRTDAAGQFWDSTFDAQGLMTMTEDPLDHGSTFTYDPTTGLKLTETTELGRQTVWTYTAGTEAAYGSAGTMPAGLVRTLRDPRGNFVTTNDYNQFGDLTRTTDAAGKQTINVFDELGRLSSTSTVWVNGAGSTVTSTVTMTFDVMSRPVTITEPIVVNQVTSASHQLLTTNVYDDNGNVTQSTLSDTFADDVPRVTQNAYDLADRQWQTTDAEGGVMTRQFDANGNVTHVIDALGRDIETTYDIANRPIDVILHGYVDPAAPASPRNITMSHTTYDDLGRPKTVTDAIGNVTENNYDSRGNRTSSVLKNFVPLTGSAYDFILWQKSFDNASRVVWEESAHGVQRTDHTYDDDNRSVIDVVKNGPVSGFTLYDKTITTTYDAASNITEVVIADGVHNTESRRLLYDAANRLIQTTIENGATDLSTYMAYDQLGNLVRQVDARGTGVTDTAFMTTKYYDNVGVLYKTELPTVTVETVAGSTTVQPSVVSGRNTFGDTTHTVDANGAISTSSFDRLGRQTAVTAASYTQPGSSPATLQPTETRVFDAVGNLRFNTDRRGNTTEYRYDSLNRATEQIDPPATTGATTGVSTVAYGDTGLTLETTTAQGVVTNFTYDKLGRTRTLVEHVTDNGTLQNLTTTTDYDGAGNVIATTGPAGGTTTAIYSRSGQLLKSTDPLGYITSYVYDTASRVIKTVSPSGVYQTTTYDLAGRAIATATFTAAGVSTLSTSATYDKVNNLLTATDTAGIVTTYTYDASSSLLSVTQPISIGVDAVTSYGYDANGKNTRVTDGNGNAWYTTYNTWGLVESRIEPATSAYPNAADRTFTTRYDNGGLPVLEMQPGVNVTRTFDNLGRLTAESTPDGANRGYSYDLANRPTTITSGGTSITIAYNERSQLVSTTGSGGSSSFRYDAAGRSVQRVDAAGTTTYSWNQNGQLHQLGDPVTGQTATYNWAAPAAAHAGQLTSVSRTSSTRTYSYDDIERLTTDTTTSGASTVWSASYHYDSAGHIDTKTIGPAGVAGEGLNSYTYDLAGQLTSWTDPGAVTTNYSYDLAGNRTSNGATAIVFDQRNRVLSEGTKAYDWSARGTLDSITDGFDTTDYAFDGLGRMSAVEGIDFEYDGLNRIVSRDAVAFSYSGLHNQPTSDGTTVLSRTPDGSPYAVAEGATTRLALLADRRGDVTATITAAGALADSIAYSPWGEPAARQGATSLTVGYQSSYTDPTSGLIDMGARWYQPSTGTFVSRDTYDGMLSAPISLNRYTYANNNPMDYFDPDGHAACREGRRCGVDSGTGRLRASVTRTSTTADRGERDAATRAAAVASAQAFERQELGQRPGIFVVVDPPPPSCYGMQCGNEQGIRPINWTGVGSEVGHGLFDAIVDTVVSVAKVALPIMVALGTYIGCMAAATSGTLVTGGASLVAGSAGCSVVAGAASRATGAALNGASLTEIAGAAFDPESMAIDLALGAATAGAGKAVSVLRTSRQAARSAVVVSITDDAARIAQSSPSSRLLGQSMEAAGVTRPAETAAHHIAAGRAGAAAESRAALARVGIDINAAENGVFLPMNLSSANPGGAAVHSTIHTGGTNGYYAAVNDLLGQATTRNEMVDALDFIRRRLLSGGFP